MLNIGEKVFIITRRAFDSELRRHFVGEIQDVNQLSIRARGYAFVFDEAVSDFVRHDDVRVRIFSLIDAVNVIHVIPRDTTIENIRYIFEKNQRYITDGIAFKMNISEFGINR